MHKQNKHDCAITDNICTSGTKVELYDARFITLCFPVRMWHETMKSGTSRKTSITFVTYHSLVSQPLHKGGGGGVHWIYWFWNARFFFIVATGEKEGSGVIPMYMRLV